MSPAPMKPLAMRLPPALVKVKVEGHKILTPLQRDVSELSIDSDEDYQTADMLLSDIKRAREDWSRKIGPITAPLKEAMDKLKESMTGAVTLNREVDGPLGILYDAVRGKMADYQRRDMLAKAELETQKQLESARLTQQIEETTQRELDTTSKALRNKLATRREALTAEAEQLEEVVTAQVKGTASVARTVKAWRLAGTDKQKIPTEAQLVEILKAIIAKKIPRSAVALDYAFINKTHLTQRDSMVSWPGFELFDDVVIAGR